VNSWQERLANRSGRVLLVLTSLSFFDQYQQMVQLGNNEGLSSRYLLLNLISATEQLALGLHTILVNGGGGNDGIVVPTPGLPNYLNLAQFALFWFWQLLL
jgi:hypothetical protein